METELRLKAIEVAQKLDHFNTSTNMLELHTKDTLIEAAEAIYKFLRGEK